jgi:hypothetical protein
MTPTRKCVLGEREREQARRTAEKGSEMGGGGVDTPQIWVFRREGRGKGDNFASHVFPVHNFSMLHDIACR